jgi:hypothetical protein
MEKKKLIRYLESLLKVVSDNDLLDCDDVEVYYRNSDRIINGAVIDDAWKVLEYKGKLEELLLDNANPQA